MSRKVKANPIKLSHNWRIVNKRVEPVLKGMSHVMGQAAAIRFFDKDSNDDYLALKKILSHKTVKNWMDDTGYFTKSDYKFWAGKETDESFLFAVHDTRLPTIKDIKKVKGFVSFSFERSEKFRLKRLIKSGLISPNTKGKYFLEISMALMLGEGGGKLDSGLMSSALRQGCLQVKSILNCKQQSDIIIFGFVDPKNISSNRSVNASGFIKKGITKYDSDSAEESIFYVISWPKLHRKINKNLLKISENKAKIIQEPQKTDSHCGPAVTKALLKFNQIDVSQDQVVEAAKIKLRIKPYGMQPKHISFAISKLAPNFQYWFKQNATGRDLNELIHTYHLPVGVNWQGLFYDSIAEERRTDPKGPHGHYSIATDIELKKDEITIDDPYSKYFSTPRIFSFRWFKKRWWDKDIEKGKLVLETHKYIFVLVPKGTTFPERLGLKQAL